MFTVDVKQQLNNNNTAATLYLGDVYGQCWGFLLIWLIKGKRAYSACSWCNRGVGLDIFPLVYQVSFLSPSLIHRDYRKNSKNWDT